MWHCFARNSFICTHSHSFAANWIRDASRVRWVGGELVVVIRVVLNNYYLELMPFVSGKIIHKPQRVIRHSKSEQIGRAGVAVGGCGLSNVIATKYLEVYKL